MTIEETEELIDRIRSQRSTFLGHLDHNGRIKAITEWHRILEPYDAKDVNSRLTDYFMDSNNFGKFPDAYYLIKFLKTAEEKEKICTLNCRCQICGSLVPFEKYDDHFDRCSSIEYITKKRLKYFNKKTNKEELFMLSRFDFGKKYNKFLEKIYELEENPIEKHNIKNYILTNKGFEPDFNIQEVLKHMNG